MKIILKTVPILLAACGFMHGARAIVPVNFVPADSGPPSCTVLGQQGSVRISSSRLDLGFSGQKIDFLKSRTDVPCTLEKTENRLSIFTGANPAEWRSRLPVARQIRFRSIYPGIDIVYYGSGSRLEYDFEVAAGAAASRIQLGFARNAELKISPAGDLDVSVNGSTFVQHRPRARQQGRDIAARYAIGRGGKRVRIELGPYDRSQPLTIDPVLAWEASADSAGSGAYAVAADGGGNMWILGYDSAHSNLPYTQTFGQQAGTSRNVLLLKIDPTGSQLLYAVLLGGSGGEVAYALAIDAFGAAYITGSTSSTDFPVTANAFQTVIPSDRGAAFVVKVSPQGDSLVYATFLGGTGGALGTAIAVDQAGNAFVAGQVTPPDFPLTTGSWEDHFGVYPQSVLYALRPIAGGFVTKLNTTGTALLYSTLIDETPVGITLSAADQAYVIGGAPAYLPPLTQFTLVLGDLTQQGTVVTRLTPDGSRADQSVLLGCTSSLYFSSGLIALDSKNDIVVGASSACPAFPAGTSSAFQPQHAPGALNGSYSTIPYNGLIVKIAPDASTVLAATFLGGAVVDEISSIGVAADDSILVAGGTSSGNFPVTPDALQPGYSGGAIPAAGLVGDGFFAHLSPNLNQLLYSTYLGGSAPDFVLAMALDLAGNAYLGGNSASGLQIPGAFSFGSPGPMWALKLAQDDAPPPVISSVSPTSLTAGSGDSTIQLTGSNFVSNASVILNGASLPTTFQSSTQVTAVVGAASLATTGSLPLRVLNPGSGASNLFVLPVIAAAGNNPAPQIQSLLPSGLTAGSPGQNVTVTGTGFIPSTIAAIDGNARSASLNGDGTLAVSLTDMDVSTPGVLSLTLTNPVPGGGAAGPVPFVVAPGLVPLPPPGLASISPSTASAGAAPTTVSIAASGFSSSAVVRWNGVDHPISLNISNGYVFTASASDLAYAGAVEVTIHDYATGLDSNPLPFWITLPGTFTDLGWNVANGMIYISGTNSLTVLNPATGAVAATIPTTIRISRFVISPEGSSMNLLMRTRPCVRLRATA